MKFLVVGGGVAARDHHMRPGLGQRHGSSQSDAAAPASDPGDLAFEGWCHVGAPVHVLKLSAQSG